LVSNLGLRLSLGRRDRETDFALDADLVLISTRVSLEAKGQIIEKDISTGWFWVATGNLSVDEAVCNFTCNWAEGILGVTDNNISKLVAESQQCS